MHDSITLEPMAPTGHGDARHLIRGLRPGLYRLAQDVTNPSADRRRKRDWVSAVTFPAGMLLRLHYTRNRSNDTSEDVKFARTTHYGQLSLGWVHPTKTGAVISVVDEYRASALAMLPSLEPVALTIDNAEHYYSYGRECRLLREMVQRGLITPSQMLSVLDQMDTHSFYPDIEED